ncbi:hypothetical protein CJ255_04585 [Candidatus Viridilinea mediisalina]|uniref:Lipopolysaccharide biosynthesis protein n=2 Tax=Candidatus Viridilinea mediisalina TaxID=2024553 RepID=A0A2A6RME2_9CHLR|nr:hypothetical protein CJ255_04585 [Candidatus Viridilinea mediisalina]
MLTWRDVFYYVKLFLRWWFVIVAAIILAASTAWFVVRQQPNMYSSVMTLSVGTNFSVAAPDQAQVGLSNVLADYYAAIAKREVIIGPVVEQLGLDFSWWVLRDRMLSTRVDRGANLLEIRIADTDPERAAIIANALGDALIRFTPTSQDHIEAQQSQINRQIQQIERDLQETEARLAELQSRMTSLTSAIDINDIQRQIETNQAVRERLRGEYSILVGLSNETLVNTLTVFEAAEPLPYPLPKKTTLTMAMAGAGALVLAIMAILLLDMLDERWRTGGELQSRTRLKSLGEVPDTPPALAAPPKLAGQREHAINQSYTNMVLAAQNRLPRSLLISSPQPSAARSAVALDLATMYARTGHRVIIVDAANDEDALLDQLELVAAQLAQSGWHPNDQQHVVEQNKQNGLLNYLKPSAIDNVLVLSGRNAGHQRLTSLVPLVYWSEMVSRLGNVADIIIFDGPASLQGPEAGILASLVDGSLLVLDGRQDPRSTVMKARQHLGQALKEQFLGAIVVRQASGGWQQHTPSKPSQGGKKRFQLALNRQGITIVLGEQDVVSQAVHATSHESYDHQHHLALSSVEQSSTPNPAPNEATDLTTDPKPTATAYEDVTLRWEDLLKLEQSAQTTPEAETHGHREATSEATTQNAQAGFWKNISFGRSNNAQRRPRIANGSRSSRIRMGRPRREVVLD